MLNAYGIDRASGPDAHALVITRGGAVEMVINRDELNGKNAKRKAEREFIARAIVAIVERHGANVRVHRSAAVPGWSRASIDLEFSLNGVGATIYLDDLFGGAWSLIHWHNTESPVRNFSKRFVATMGDLPNSRPHHKSTSSPSNWYSLAMLLDGGLCLAARGEAFEPFDL